jgi:hypothetical protein
MLCRYDGYDRYAGYDGSKEPGREHLSSYLFKKEDKRQSLPRTRRTDEDSSY